MLPTIDRLAGVEKQCGADGRLIKPAGAEGAGDGQFGGPEIFWGKIDLRLAPVGQCDVELHEEVEAGEPAPAETGFGPFGPGNGDPYVTLFLGERLPTLGDRAEVAADSDLGGAAGIKRDEGRIADLAVTSALPHCIPAFA